MSEIMRPILEIAVIIPGMLLAYLPVKTCPRQAPFKYRRCRLPGPEALNPPRLQ